MEEVYKMYILAMSKPKQAIEYQLYNIADPLIEHLTKIALYPDSDYKNHWVSEVYAFLHIVPLMKGNNKRPKASIILECTWGVWKDSYDTVYSLVISEYENSLGETNISQNNAYKFCEEYIEDLAIELSNNGKVNSAWVNNKINLLLNLFHII